MARSHLPLAFWNLWLLRVGALRFGVLGWAGPARGSMQNAAMPLFNLGVGVKMKFGNLFTTFEFGVSGFTIPFMALSIGYDGDSKITKEQRRIAALPAPATPVAPEPATPTPR